MMGQKNLDTKATNAAWEFFHQKEEFDQTKKEFEEAKKQFEEIMLEYMSKGKSATFESDGFTDGQLVVKKVEKTSIEWDAEKLEKRVEKSVAKQVIKKQYRIANMRGLVQYLKSCGVDPKIFKKFLLVDKTVDEKAVGRLGDTGELTVRQISGCYLVKSQKPYFIISVKKDDGDGEW